MTLSKTSKPFIAHLESWLANLPKVKLNSVTAQPENTAVMSVDIINGFCTIGPLASPRIQGIVKPIIKLMKAAHKKGVHNFVLTQDTHPADAVEFANFPPHCVRGTSESETVPEYKKLPFANEFVVVEKNSISSAHNTGLDKWLNAHKNVDTFVVVGDCSDLCTYQLAMHLRLRANAAQKNVRVVLPENCVQTYDTPVALANKLGIPPHDGDLLHVVFCSTWPATAWKW
jgi:nicotinamidase-related amidase